MLTEIDRPPRVFILRMRHVPAIDATGIHALEQMAKKCAHEHIKLVICEVGDEPRGAIDRSGKLESVEFAQTLDDALRRADSLSFRA